MAVLCSLCFCGPERSVSNGFSQAKWFYCICFALTAVLTWVLRDEADVWLTENVPSFGNCLSQIEQQQQQQQSITSTPDASGSPSLPPAPPTLPPGAEHCGGKEVAVRISFANLCFFTAHFLLLLGLKRQTDWRWHIHGGFWPLKLLVWASTIAVCLFFLPESVLYGYAMAARVLSGIFLVVQLVLLVGLVYDINEWLLARVNAGSDSSRCTRGLTWTALVGGAIATFSLSLALIGILYHVYAPHSSCSLNIFFITWSLVIGLVLVGVLFVPGRAESAGLLTSGAVFLYCTFLLYSALSSKPVDEECTRGSGTSAQWIQIVAFFITIASVVYSTISAGIASRDFFNSSTADDKDLHEELPYRADFFHLVFLLASAYIAMLFTNWQVSSSTSDFELDQGWASTWVKMASKWACEVLYIWSVVAPAVFSDRDFGSGMV